MAGEDRYKYFRIECRELLEALSSGVLELERGEAEAAAVGRLLRVAHTLKGACRVVRQPRLAELAHELEDLLGPLREGGKVAERVRIDRALALLDEFGAGVKALDAPAAVAVAEAVSMRQEPTVASRQPVAQEEEPIETIRVELAELDGLLEDAYEASVQTSALRVGLPQLEKSRRLVESLREQLGGRGAAAAGRQRVELTLSRVRELAAQASEQLERGLAAIRAGVDRVERELADFRGRASHLRLVPVAVLFHGLERAARDAARALGREVEVTTSGGEVRLDAHVLAALREALLHLVRNAVAHGVEPPAARVAAGKPACGRVRISVSRERGEARVVCADDGRGLDQEAIWRAATARGLAPAGGESRTLDEMIRVLMRGGVSTTSDADHLSGRGIGLAAAQESLARLGGDIEVRSVSGQGVTFELRMPITMSALTALDVTAGGVEISIPLDAVRQVVRVGKGELFESGDGLGLTHEGGVVTFVPLARLLGREAPGHPRERTWSAVLVERAGRRVAMGVDRVQGIENVVVRSIPAAAETSPVVAGASLDASGNPRLLVDPAAAVELATSGMVVSNSPGSREPLPVLVVDDSLTTRMLEQSILETAGYQVHLATSGEEALQMAGQTHYSLFVVDVEMPGMDGFEFVERTRAHPDFRQVPAILVTSRSSLQDLERGSRVGASAYIVKSDFDQNVLLRKIRELVS